MIGFRAPEEKPAGAYADVRERLVAMGYLDRPLDRFVLSGIGRPGSFVRRHAGVSLRIALAAAPLLGLLFALAVVIVNRPRFSTTLDFSLLTFYFSLLFGAVVFGLEFGAGIALAAFVRWRGRGVAAYQATAARAGFAVSLLLSAYLAFWWRRRAGGAGGPLLDLTGLAALLIVNAALFRVSSLASLAVLVRASDLPAPAQTRQGAGIRLLGLVAASLLTIGFFLAPRSAAPARLTPFEPIAVPGRLIVLAWDGIPFQAVPDDLGGLTAVRGRSGPHPLYMAPLAPAADGAEISRPAYWTEIATGRTTAEHGVGGVEAERVAGLSSPLAFDAPLGTVLTTLLPGRRVAVSAGLRRAGTLWEILGFKEGIGVVGWWATWPAAGHGGSGEHRFQVVSDRAVFGVQGERPAQHGIDPPELAGQLAGSRAADLAAIRVDLADRFQSLRGSDRARLEEAGIIDGYALRVASRLLSDPELKDLFVYLPGLDIIRMGGGSGPAARLSPDLHASTVEYAQYLEQLISRIAGALSPEDWLVIIGDPGRAGATWPGSDLGPSARNGPVAEGGYGADHRPGSWGSDPQGGWILISGPGVATGTASQPWSPLDVAPSLLNLRGFPRSQDMRGRSQVEFLSPEWRQRLVPREVASFGDTSTPALPSIPSSEEDETLERLRSLGYVE